MRITKKELEELGFSYDPNTGIVSCSKTRGGRKAGPVGSPRQHGYLRTRILNHYYQIHRLAFILMGVELGDKYVDHINGQTNDNRWSNLRLVTHQQNQRNQYKHRDGKIVGVDKWKKYWRARDGSKTIGYFKTKKDAVEAVSKLKDGY